MVLKWISIVTLFFKYNYLDIAKSKYDIQIDFDISFYVPNHNHSISSKIPIYKSNSSVNQKLVSRNGFGQRYKVHKAKSRSLTGMTHLSNMPCKDDSRYCTTISARSCTQPLQADVCKRTCGLWPCVDHALQNVRNRNDMVAGGWTIDAPHDGYAKYCGGYNTFWGYKNGSPDGYVAAIFKGSGIATLNFGNCWEGGITKVYLNGQAISSAGPYQSSMVARFNYKIGSPPW